MYEINVYFCKFLWTFKGFHLWRKHVKLYALNFFSFYFEQLGEYGVKLQEIIFSIKSPHVLLFCPNHRIAENKRKHNKAQ